MDKVMKKLSLWDTRTFRPIMTHDDLSPIMTSLGFVPLPSSSPSPSSTTAWREYAFSAAATRTGATEQLPRPRLPFPRVDGLHLLSYLAFVDAVAFYIGPHRVADHFHVRGMPLHRMHDRCFDKAFRKMSDECLMSEDEGIFVYRDGTLDQATMSFSPSSSSPNIADIIIRNRSSATGPLCLVPLKDIIPSMDLTV